MSPTLPLINCRILILHAGGTIGMQATPQGLAPYADFPRVLAAHLAPLAAQLPAFSIEAFATPIDSAEARPQDWAAIATAIVARWDGFDGFVVLHGTDTLAYTGSALSFMLRDLDKPVVLTGAQVPLGGDGSDGLGNVVAALQLAADARLCEVTIAFAGRLLRANRTTKISTRQLEGFGSPNLAPLASVSTAVDGEPGARATNAATWLARSATGPRFEIPPATTPSIVSLRLTPGFMPALLDACLDLAPRAIILECYGTGNVPSLDGRLGAFLDTALRLDIVVVAVTQVTHGGLSLGTYAAGSVLVAGGVVNGRDMTFEACFTKLSHLIGVGLDAPTIRAQTPRSLAGELSET